jgi:hypothetical protein
MVWLAAEKYTLVAAKLYGDSYPDSQKIYIIRSQNISGSITSTYNVFYELAGPSTDQGATLINNFHISPTDTVQVSVQLKDSSDQAIPNGPIIEFDYTCFNVNANPPKYNTPSPSPTLTHNMTISGNFAEWIIERADSWSDISIL